MFKRFKYSARNASKARLRELKRRGGRGPDRNVDELGEHIIGVDEMSTLFTAYLEFDGKLWETEVLKWLIE